MLKTFIFFFFFQKSEIWIENRKSKIEFELTEKSVISAKNFISWNQNQKGSRLPKMLLKIIDILLIYAIQLKAIGK